MSAKKVEHWKKQIQDTIERASDELSRAEYIEFIGEIGASVRCLQDCIDEEEAE